MPIDLYPSIEDAKTEVPLPENGSLCNEWLGRD